MRDEERRKVGKRDDLYTVHIKMNSRFILT